MRKIPLWWWLLVVVAMFLLAPVARCQDIYVPACSTNYTCQVTNNQPWATGNQTWIFAPIAPNVSIYVYVHNDNTLGSHTSQNLRIFQTGSPIVSNLSSNADQWVEDAVTQNTTSNASCNAVQASSPTVPGASGTGTCYVITMAAAQIALKMTGAATIGGGSDTFDISIVQVIGYPGGPKPGGDSSSGGSGASPSLAGTGSIASNTSSFVPPGAVNTAPLQVALFALSGGGSLSPLISGSLSADSSSGATSLAIDENIFNGSTWDRQRSPISDSQAATGLTASGGMVWNGTNWDRAATVLGDGATTVGRQSVLPLIFNGTTWDRDRSASAANTGNGGTPLTGVNLSEKGARWSVVSSPGGGSQATASKAAGGAGVRHVVDCVSFSATSSAAIVAAIGVVNVRDGATGAGTIIWQYNVAFPTAAALGLQDVSPQQICGLNLIGTANTAMTVEFGAAVTGASQTVNISGYDVQ